MSIVLDGCQLKSGKPYLVDHGWDCSMLFDFKPKITRGSHSA